MRTRDDVFHLAVPALDLDDTYGFYVTGLGCKLARPVPKDRPLTFDDVVFPQGRVVDRLYAEQEALFAPGAMAA